MTSLNEEMKRNLLLSGFQIRCWLKVGDKIKFDLEEQKKINSQKKIRNENNNGSDSSDRSNKYKVNDDDDDDNNNSDGNGLNGHYENSNSNSNNNSNFKLNGNMGAMELSSGSSSSDILSGTSNSGTAVSSEIPMQTGQMISTTDSNFNTLNF